MFEPVHGSAPTSPISGIANPIAAIWSAAMMLDHLGEARRPRAMMAALEATTARGVGVTPGKDRTDTITEPCWRRSEGRRMTHVERTAALPLKDADLFRERALIGGAWVEAASGARVAVVDPATGATLGHVPDVSATETRAAIEAAEAAFGPWRRRTHAERAALLEAWFALMLDHADDLARILTAEQGKPLAEARGEIPYGAPS